MVFQLLASLVSTVLLLHRLGPNSPGNPPDDRVFRIYSIGKEEAKKSLDVAMNKSGLVSSSGLEEKKSSTWKQFALQETGLNNRLGEAMASIEEGYEGEKLRIESEEKRLKLQKGQFERQSQSWYLGKNIFG